MRVTQTQSILRLKLKLTLDAKIAPPEPDLGISSAYIEEFSISDAQIEGWYRKGSFSIFDGLPREWRNRVEANILAALELDYVHEYIMDERDDD